MCPDSSNLICLLSVLKHPPRKNVKEFVRLNEEVSTSMYLATLFDLDTRVRQQHDAVPSDFGDGTSIQMLVGEGLRRSAFHLHSIYYVCMIFLHASVVPVLSGSAASKGLSPLVTKLSATTALSNAFAFAKMAKEYLRTTPDFTKLPPFVGYCAFVAGSVLNAAGVHLGSKSANQNHEGSLVCATVIQELSTYWPVFNSFVRSDFPRGNGVNCPPTLGSIPHLIPLMFC